MANGKRPGWHALGPILTIIGVLLLTLSPLGYRLGWFGVPIALLRLIPAGLIACALGLVLSLIAIARTPAGAGNAVPLAAVIIAIAVCVIPVLGIVHARQVPRIHDITTDTVNPPVFVALASKRREAPNGLDYEGAQVAAEQKQAYPDLATLHSKLSPDALFERAQQVVRDCGWQLAEANRAEGRIEATDTTRLYGFKDDIVVRIRAEEGGSALDVRSVSRVGRSDIGANAARIRKFLGLLAPPSA